MMFKTQSMNQLTVALMLVCTVTQPAHAGERESLDQLRTTTLSLIELLVQEGVLSKSKAEALIRESEAAKRAADRDQLAAGAAAASEPAARSPAADGQGNVVRVQYVPEHVKKEMREDIEKEVMAKLNYKAGERLGLPGWIDRIQWEGDIRLRYEMNQNADSNVPAFFFQTSELRNSNINNTTEERNRFRVRARLAANVKITDLIDGGIRLTTGPENDPVSANQTLQTTESKYTFGLDRAFIRMHPTDWVTLSGGRIENPFFNTDLVWDPDLSLDGIAATFKPKFNNRWSAFGSLGAFSIDEQEKTEINKAKDKWLFAAQAGLQWTSASKSSVRFGVALYDFKNVEGQTNPSGSIEYTNTALAFRDKGNSTFSIDRIRANEDLTGGPNGAPDGIPDGLLCGQGGPCGLASKFRNLNLTGQIDLATFDPIHVTLTADYVRNLGFDKEEILRRTGNEYKEETEGYQLILSVGKPNIVERHDWQIFGALKYVEADAVLDGFTESIFHLGGTNTKGWILGANYGIDKNTMISARWLSADEISDWNSSNPVSLPLANDVLLVDLQTRF